MLRLVLAILASAAVADAVEIVLRIPTLLVLLKGNWEKVPQYFWYELGGPRYIDEMTWSKAPFVAYWDFTNNYPYILQLAACWLIPIHLVLSLTRQRRLSAYLFVCLLLGAFVGAVASQAAPWYFAQFVGMGASAGMTFWLIRRPDRDRGPNGASP